MFESPEYRIEADRAMRDYDALEVDAGIMGEALSRIAEGRRNEAFDPWARQVARDALAQVSERVTGILPMTGGDVSRSATYSLRLRWERFRLAASENIIRLGQRVGA